MKIVGEVIEGWSGKGRAEAEGWSLVAMAMLQKMASIDAQMRLLVPKKVSEDDKLIEYDALLLDRFLDILQDLHGKELKETVTL